MYSKSELRFQLDEVLSNFRNDLDYITESINIHTDIDFFNMERAKLIEQSNQISKEKNQDIENGLYPNVIYKDFRLYVFKSSREGFVINNTCFNIIRDSLNSLNKINIIDYLNIDDISYAKYLYLKNHNVLKYYKIDKEIKTNFLNNIDDNKVNSVTLDSDILFDNHYKSLFNYQNLKYLHITHTNIKRFIYDHWLYYLDLSNNKYLKEIIVNNRKNTLKAVNVEYTLVPYDNLLELRSLESIKGFNNLSTEDGDKFYYEDFEKIKKLKSLSMSQELSNFIKTSNISNVLEFLEVCSNYDIYDDVGKLKHLKIESETCPHIKCYNLEYLEIIAKFISYYNIKNCKLLKTLKIEHHIDYDEDICPGDYQRVEDLEVILNFNQLTSLELIDVIIPSNISFGRLNNLKEFKLELYYDETLNKNTFAGLSSLDNLSITNVKLENGVFNELTNLTKLSLSQIDNLYEDLFYNLPLLTSLSISGSYNLTKLSDLIFSKQYRLQYLKISDNIRLTTLAPKIFSNLYSLVTLDLSNNCLNQLDDNIFSNLFSIIEINLFKYSHLKDSSLFRNLTTLRHLYIDIKLVMFNQVITSDFSKLSKLDICIKEYQNKNVNIKENIFSNLSNLNHFKIIGEISLSDNFVHLSNLQYLHLNCVYFNHDTLNDYKSLEDVYIDISEKKAISLINNNKNLIAFDSDNNFTIPKSHEYCNK